MKKALFAIPAAAIVLAACGSAVTHSLSASSVKQVSLGNGIQLAAGTKAADVSDIGNRTNPPIQHAKIVNRPITPSTPRSATVNAGQPSIATTSDRCGGGSSAAGSSNRAATSSAKHPPLPMCAPE
jgi:ABC-type Fe3+-hydroxamate transport system substrate-binding protein